MDTAEREQMRALAQAATPGPWHRNIPPVSRYPVIFAGRNTHVLAIKPRSERDAHAEANADYVVAANPAALLALLDTTERLERERDALARKNDGSRLVAECWRRRAESAERYNEQLCAQLQDLLPLSEWPDSLRVLAQEGGR